jgi:serine/threonine protein kinase
MKLNPVLGQYRLLEQIGHGGMGEVYVALDTRANRRIALKLLREEFARDPYFIGDFFEEASMAVAMRHPHICEVYQVGEQDGWYYIAMELLEGRTLESLVQEHGALPEPEVLRIGIEVSEALRAAARQQMIHGDIKPANLFISRAAGAKLLDFGLSRLTNIGLWASDGVWGSPYYISPERVRRQTEGFCSDIYSLGATLFHALTGIPPFDGDTPEQIAAKRLQEKPPTVASLNPTVSAAASAIVARMLQLNPVKRYPGYEPLLADLGRAAGALAGQADAGAAPRGWRWFGRK